ncbi:hypothetical protein MLD38_024772 [Melastoma candidum]|uniref:Uncharacterized protein n=1 Tax=Melastoma candidum TaxID=119954 RepID=A0ACB9NTE9_9MYRT|nr:hypothetical protein MLD38_024772 [Melastoma candidum]
MSGSVGFGGIGLIAPGFGQRGTVTGDDLDLIPTQQLQPSRKVNDCADLHIRSMIPEVLIFPGFIIVIFEGGRISS